jgi:hypothetical protein
MPDYSIVNPHALLATSISLHAQANELPAGAPDPLVISACGDNGVIEAARSFSMWAALTGIVQKDGIDTVASQLEGVLREYGMWDAQAAKNLKAVM